MRKSNQEDCQARSTWLQLVKLLVEEGRCDPTTAHHGVTNFILHQWDGPVQTPGWLCRQAWLATCGHEDRLQVGDSSVDQLVTRLIQDGSDVHALDSSGSTPLNKALDYFVTYCDSSPLRASNFAHESREVFRIENLPSDYVVPGSKYGSRANLDGSPDSVRRFGQFLNWWFERLDGSGYELNDYIRQEGTLQPPLCKFRQDCEILGAKISKTFLYDKTAQSLELSVECAWTKIGDIQDQNGRPRRCPYACSTHKW